ncbi:hypothetical protein DAPPUDRAFT_259081 [Daphnia pulex]|uniref:Uncharacterized protein n=1 Tax=Daphnia pulex TaxID=6669 RepID=E9HGJ0_DAPPU|nr:hypothetical protein DAPPUDRAFT_259081 [Daphnia pulex]|eukprot:EFX69141.1 hypothetical protein DAPPUDRAFT_259081 [Daphnia pulex]
MPYEAHQRLQQTTKFLEDVGEDELDLGRVVKTGSPKEVDSRFGDPFDDHRMRRRLRSTMFELRREDPELVDPLCFETTITFCKVTERSG